MKELKSDYHAGKISDEKYEELSQKYMLKLKNIDATSKIRAMQGRRQVNNNSSSTDKSFNKKQMELSRKEDEKLVEKYIVNPKRVTNGKGKIASESNNKTKYSIIAVIFLILAFSAGIGYGVLNFDFNSVVASHTSAVVTDSAFPLIVANTTNTSSTASSSSSTSSSNAGTSSSSSHTTSSSSSSSPTTSSSSPSSTPTDTGGSDNPDPDPDPGDDGGSVNPDPAPTDTGGSTTAE